MVYVWHPVFVLVGDSFQITSGFMLEFDITQGYLCCRKYFKNGSEHSSTFGSFVPLKRQGSIGRRNLAIFKTKVFSKLYFFLLSHTFESLNEHSQMFHRLTLEFKNFGEFERGTQISLAGCAGPHLEFCYNLNYS
jgi:hypothetical protein